MLRGKKNFMNDEKTEKETEENQEELDYFELKEKIKMEKDLKKD